MGGWLQGAVQEMARSLASSLWQQLGPASLPVAKVSHAMAHTAMPLCGPKMRVLVSCACLLGITTMAEAMLLMAQVLATHTPTTT